MDSVAYIQNVVASVEAYKDTRDNIEKMFNEVARFPDTNLAPVGGQSDEENLQEKRKLYQWSTVGGYPPYLLCIPERDEVDTFDIFDEGRFNAVQEKAIIMECAEFFGAFVGQAPTMASIENRYKDLHQTAQQCDKADVYKEANVGLRSDWYTDAVFAQQHFTGANPTGLRQASSDWIAAFVQVAIDQKNSGAQQLLSASPSESLYTVDNSDYRYLLGLAPDDLISAPGPAFQGMPVGRSAYGCATVTLFSLSDCGKLHPVAICLDYKGSMSKSVTIFNKRLTPDVRCVDESQDWPWRYAKMCSMTSDWIRHEVAVHLTETHLLQEAIIIAAQRNLPDSHIICKLLHPHWFKTLSLNFLGRQALIPKVIGVVSPLRFPQLVEFIKASYTNFDFTGRYAPIDLQDRGFGPSELDDEKFHNYLYARNIFKIWGAIRSFVCDVLHSAYPNGDADVVADKYIHGFCTEMRSQKGGQLPSFPRSARTLDELIDLVTMCIHIAAPQHSAVNYLQQFYLSFVPNRPASLAAPLPDDLESLRAYTEEDVVGSLPIKGVDVGKWMLMVQVPYLLSAEVDAESNIERYAAETTKSCDKRISAAGEAFLERIQSLKATFDGYNEQMDDKVTEYHVLDPKVVARSILI